MRVQGAIDIFAPPEKIWPFLVESDKVLQWYTTLQKFEYAGKKNSGVGTGFYLEEKAAGRLLELNFEVTEWVENEQLAFGMTSGNFLKAYDQKWTVVTTPYGSRFIFVERIEFPYGIIGVIIGLFARRFSERTVEEIMVKLKNLVEA